MKKKKGRKKLNNNIIFKNSERKWQNKLRIRRKERLQLINPLKIIQVMAIHIEEQKVGKIIQKISQKLIIKQKMEIWFQEITATFLVVNKKIKRNKR